MAKVGGGGRGWRRALAGVLGVGVLGVALSGCGGSSSSGTSAAADAPARSITLYAGQHEQTVKPLVADFTRRTGIAVKVRAGDEAELANQIIQEGASSPADVFFAENSPALEGLRRRALLAPVARATLAQVPRRYSSPQGSWVGFSGRASVLAYNPGRVAAGQLPRSVLDVARSARSPRAGFAPTESDFQPLVSAVSVLRGSAVADRWLAGLKANGKAYNDNESLVAAVNRGEVAMGLMPHYYFYRLRAELGPARTRVRLSYFAAGDPGALVAISGAAVLRSSARKPAAQRFLSYLVSRSAQRIIVSSQSFEYPLRPGIADPRLARPLAALGAPAISPAQLGDGRSSLARLQQAGLL